MTEVVAALIREGERFMICQRPAHKARGLLWEFVGGKIEPGETGEQALARECREELDVDVAADGVFTQIVHEYPDLTIRLTVYNAHIVSGTPRLLEHADLRWITPAEIPLYPFCPADTPVLEMLCI
ncbi:MAG: (deoxy)nucleoside triphosphate pyrophosphohydrolase [Clostridia bacterium]|nr:(deoxy)nucleoside triphosphate pyrophosphohydrolase [Clostridia bacterium]